MPKKGELDTSAIVSDLKRPADKTKPSVIDMDSGKVKPYGISMPTGMYDAIRQVAKEQEKTIARFVQGAIRRAIEEHRRNS